MVIFEGELLFERKDDNVAIKLEELKLKNLKVLHKEGSIWFDSEPLKDQLLLLLLL